MPPKQTFLSWLGRQVGHVHKAVKTDVSHSKATDKTPGVSANPTSPVSPSASATADSRVIFRSDDTQERDLPGRPGVKLRRTVIDEVVVKAVQKP